MLKGYNLFINMFKECSLLLSNFYIFFSQIYLIGISFLSFISCSYDLVLSGKSLVSIFFLVIFCLTEASVSSLDMNQMIFYAWQ